MVKLPLICTFSVKEQNMNQNCDSIHELKRQIVSDSSLWKLTCVIKSNSCIDKKSNEPAHEIMVLIT